jgi:putative repA replicase protein
VAILPVNDSTSDDADKDLVKPLLASIAALKSAKKSAAWVDEMMALREDAEEAGSIGFCSRIFTQLSLPYRDPGTSGAITWVRQNGPMRLQLNPLLDIDDSGQPVPAFPYGKYPRLILPWLSTQVVLREADLESDGSLTIELGDSMRDFLKLLDLPYGGKSGRLMREQARRLFGADILFSEDRGRSLLGDRRQRVYKIPVSQAYELWWDYDVPDQQALWGNNVRLSSAFVQSVLTAKIPTDMRALKLLSEKGGPLAMDIYLWLSYRLFVARRPTLVPWEALQAQFGSQTERPRRFKQSFTSKLILISLVYPEAVFKEVDKGLMIYPSPSPLGRKRLPRPERAAAKWMGKS